MDIDFDSLPLTAADSFPGEVRDPFAAQVAEERYFLDENRKLSLNKLIHLAPHYRLIAVEGPDGVGKSCLLAQFVARVGESLRVGVIRCHALTDTEEFLRELTAQIGVRVNPKSSRDEVLEELGLYLLQLGRSGRRAIIVLEDAELLAEGVIALLQVILRDERSHDGLDLILSGVSEPLAKVLAALPQSVEYTVHIEPLDEQATADYVRHRLGVAGAEDQLILFKDSVLRRVHKNSRGLPAQINLLGQEILAKARGGGHRRSVGLPPLRWLGIGVLILGAGSVLIWQDKINELVSPSATVNHAAVSQEVVVTAPLPVPEMQGDIRRDAASPPPAAAEATTDVPASEQARAAVAPTVTPSVPPGEIKPEPAPTTPAPAAKAELANPVAPAPVAEASAKPKLDVENRKPDQNWLQAQAGNHYTLQLMAMEDAAKVQEFVKSRKIEDDSATFQVKRNGKVLTVLIYGSYSNQQQAQQAASTLMQDWGVDKPWIRNFNSVRQAAK